MQEVEVSKVKAGMVLAEPATDMMGNPLFNKGTVLNVQEIKTLKAWGVHSVIVDRIVKILPGHPEKFRATSHRKTTQILRNSASRKTSASPEEKGQEKNIPADKAGEIEHMFALHKGNPLMDKIKEITLSQLSRNMQ